MFASQDVDKEVTGGVDDGEEAVGEDMEDETPDRRATCHDVFGVYGLVEVENKPGKVAEDKDNHDKESDDKIGELPDVVTVFENFEKDSEIQKRKKKEGQNSQSKEPENKRKSKVTH